MAKYVQTGKINFPKTLLAFAIAVPLAALVGVAYGFLMDLNPFIIVDLLILAIFVALLIATSSGMVRVGSIRNKGIKFMLAVLVSFIGWYTSWAFLVNRHFFEDLFQFSDTFDHIARYLNHAELSFGKMTSSASIEIDGAGMWTLAILEALIFLIPVAFSFGGSKDYFCEACQKFNLYQQSYITAPQNDAMLDSAEYTGNFRELAQFPRTEKIPHVSTPFNPAENIYKLEISYCRNCKKNGVINITQGHYKLNDKKTAIEFVSKSKVVKDTVADDATITAFINPDKEGSEYNI